MNRVVASGHLCRGIKSDDLVAEDAATVLTRVTSAQNQRIF